MLSGLWSVLADLRLGKAHKNLVPAPAFRSLMIVSVWHPKLCQVVFYKPRATTFAARNQDLLHFVLAAVIRVCRRLHLVSLRADIRGGRLTVRVLEAQGWQSQSRRRPVASHRSPQRSFCFQQRRDRPRQSCVAWKTWLHSIGNACSLAACAWLT